MRTVLLALAFACLAEGFGPLFMPERWSDALSRMVRMKPGQLRFVGLAACAAGCVFALAAAWLAPGPIL